MTSVPGFAKLGEKRLEEVKFESRRWSMAGIVRMGGELRAPMARWTVELERMAGQPNFREYRSDKRLTPFIRSFHIQIDAPFELHFPFDACPGLVVNLGGPFLLGTTEKDLTVFTGCRLFRYLTRRLMIKSLTRAEALAVKFRPGRLTPFSATPGIELTDTSVCAEDLWGAPGKELVGRIYEARSIPEIVSLLNAFFLKRLSLNKVADQRITGALDEILQRNSQIGIDALPRGFNDQSHFIRDWKYFTGSDSGIRVSIASKKNRERMKKTWNQKTTRSSSRAVPRESALPSPRSSTGTGTG